MLGYVIRRLLLAPLILFCVALVTFIIINLKGSPLTRFAFNPRVRPEDIERMERNLGLDKPIFERFWLYIESLLRGDLGVSLITSKPITVVLGDALPNTLRLALVSIVIAFLIAAPIAIYAATHRNSAADRFILTTAIAASSIPTVWLGLLLIILFAVKFGEWGFISLPINGVRDTRNPGGFWDLAEHMVLPVTALVIPQVAGWIWYIRNAMLEALNQDYVRTARSLGLKERAVNFSHAFRNCLTPLVTLFGLSIPEVFAGAFIVETVFGYPGMGYTTVDAIGKNDYTVIMGTTLLYATLLIIGNLIADLLYPVVDPRLRH